MTKNNESTMKNVQTQVSLECFKKLKILSIQKEITLSTVINEILERHVITKKVSSTDMLDVGEG